MPGSALGLPHIVVFRHAAALCYTSEYMQARGQSDTVRRGQRAETVHSMLARNDKVQEHDDLVA